MDVQAILERFAIISGTKLQDISQWADVCQESMYYIRKNLKDGVQEEMHSYRLNAAAAALSFYKYILCRSCGSGLASFSAGDIKIRPDAKLAVSSAQKVWQEAKNSIKDLINDEEFVFEGVV